ncbi:MAG: hypothetical protein AB7E80_05965 [Hyphomicrobiaceae bacterium]
MTAALHSGAHQQAKAADIPADVTVCITSCGRLDLLARTMESFQRFNPGGRFIISEDSGDAAIIDEVRRSYPAAKILTSTGKTGVMASIDRLYAHVETPFIFHLEDDWGFDGPVQWEAAKHVLTHRPDVANICVRAFDEVRTKYRQRSEEFEHDGVVFRRMLPDAHPEFFGWTPNPGLITKAMYLRYAPFARVYPDTMSQIIKTDGATVAYLLPGVARHIGHGRNVPDPTIPARPKGKVAKLVRGFKKKLYYWGLRKDPY